MELELFIIKQHKRLSMEILLTDIFLGLENSILIKEIRMLENLEMIRKREEEFTDGLI